MKKISLVVAVLFGLNLIVVDPVISQEKPAEQIKEQENDLSHLGYKKFVNYRKDYLAVTAEDFIAPLSNKNYNNNYVSKVYIKLGKSYLFIDSEKNPKNMILEISVLGNGPVLRQHFFLSSRGWFPLRTQLKIANTWTDSNSKVPLSLFVSDPEKLLKEGIVEEVLLSGAPLDLGPSLELRLKNQQK